MSVFKEQALFGLLSSRYDVGFSQEISDQVTRLETRDIQLLDIKELNDLCAGYRIRIRALMNACRTLRGRKQGQASVHGLYAGYEDIFTRRQLADLWKLYRVAMADSHDMTAAYMAQLCSHNRFSISHPTEKKYRDAA